MVVRKTAWLIIALFAFAPGVASAQQWDPESGDTWQAPPQEQPPQQQQPPPQQAYQQPAPQPQPQYQPAPASQTVDRERPPAMAEGAARAEVTGSDHANVAVGGIGVGWFGLQRVSYFNDAGNLAVPTIGARIWLSELLGIDAAVGFTFSSAGVSSDTPTGDVSADAPGAFAFLIHAGLPIALYHNQHYKFLLIPEIDLGFATGDLGDDPELTELSGLTFQVGARVGTEIHFGFIDIPELAVQASVGLGLRYDTATSDSCPGGDCANNVVTTRSAFGLSTAEFNEPWDILTGNVAAIYYFR